MHVICWPTSHEHRRVTQSFGHPGKVYTAAGLLGHEGLDLSCVVGTPVYAAHYGRVADLWAPKSYGQYIELIGEWELTLYGHLSAVFHAGEIVEAGTLIGLSGNTGGTSTGPHLHFGLCPLPRAWSNGYKGWVNPLPRLQEGEQIMGQALEAAKVARFDSETIERLFEEGDTDITDGQALIERGQLKHRQARLKLQQHVSPRNGVAYRPEILLGGDKPAGWEGE
jgi:hypothetical protein